MTNIHAHTDWPGYIRSLVHCWVLHGDPADPEQMRRAYHLRALARLAQRYSPQLAIGQTLTPERLFEALQDAVPLQYSVIYDLRELLDFLLLLDAEQPPFCFRTTTLDDYAARVYDAIDLAKITYSWRIARRQPVQMQVLHAS
ncbi:MAG: hypothetical protein AAFV53_38750 [Myxococcota bacterium]